MFHRKCVETYIQAPPSWALPGVGGAIASECGGPCAGDVGGAGAAAVSGSRAAPSTGVAEAPGGHQHQRKEQPTRTSSPSAAPASPPNQNALDLHPQEKLQACLSLTDLVAYAISNMVGAGIFVVIGPATVTAGGLPVVLSFVFAMLLCSFSGLSYAEFSRSIPTSGSAYAYAYVTLGELPAFLIAHLLSLSCSIGAGIGARACSGYAKALCKQILGSRVALFDSWQLGDTMLSLNLFAPLLVLLLTALQLRGARESADFNRMLVLGNMVLMGIFILLGFYYTDATLLDSEAWAAGPIVAATGQVYYSFIGFDAVCLLSQEAQNPKRNIPLALFLGLAVVCIVYALIALALAGMQPVGDISLSAPLSAAFLSHDNGWAFHLITLAAMTNTIATTFCGIMIQPRLWMHMAADSLLPESLAEVDEETQTPFFGTVLSGGIALAAAGLFEVGVLVDVCTAGMLIAYSALSVALLVARYCGVCSERSNRIRWRKKQQRAAAAGSCAEESEADAGIESLGSRQARNALAVLAVATCTLPFAYNRAGISAFAAPQEPAAIGGGRLASGGGAGASATTLTPPPPEVFSEAFAALTLAAAVVVVAALSFLVATQPNLPLGAQIGVEETAGAEASSKIDAGADEHHPELQGAGIPVEQDDNDRPADSGSEQLSLLSNYSFDSPERFQLHSTSTSAAHQHRAGGGLLGRKKPSDQEIHARTSPPTKAAFQLVRTPPSSQNTPVITPRTLSGGNLRPEQSRTQLQHEYLTLSGSASAGSLPASSKESVVGTVKDASMRSRTRTIGMGAGRVAAGEQLSATSLLERVNEASATSTAATTSAKTIAGQRQGAAKQKKTASASFIDASFPYAPIVAIVANLSVLDNLATSAQQGLGLWCVFGLILYFSYAGSTRGGDCCRLSSSRSSTYSQIATPLLTSPA